MRVDQTVEQIAALPLRLNKQGKLRVMMVTSRESKRWVMPKGWLMDGEKPWRAAAIEALEEAGAVGFVSKKSLGIYRYEKRLYDNSTINCTVTVYPMLVEKLNAHWKERKERARRWFSFRRASKLVDEPDLAALFLQLATEPKSQPAIKKLFPNSV